MIFLLALTLFSCARNDGSVNDSAGLPFGFQDNSVPNEFDDFEIVSVLKDGGTLEEIYDDIDGKGVSDKLEVLVNSNIDEFIAYSKNSSDLLDNHTGIVIRLMDTRVKGVLEWLIDRDPLKKSKLYDYTSASYDDMDAFYDPSKESAYMANYYSFLDDLSDQDEEGAKACWKEMLRFGGKACQYMIDTKDKDELRDDIQEIIDDLLDEDFEEDFLDITEFVGKMLIQADYPMWVDAEGHVLQREEIDPEKDTSLDLGNVVKGANILLRWVNKMMAEEHNRERVNDVIREIAELFNPDDSETNKKIIKQLVYNLEDLFTVGGDTYKSDPRYHQSDDEIESNAELGETLREYFPSLLQFSLRSDRDASMIVDNEWRKKIYPLYQMIQYLKNLQFDPDEQSIEDTLMDMLKYDFLGRDRTDPEAGAYPIPFLEHTMFTIATVLNLGFDDGGATGEIDPAVADVRKNHGHGTSRAMLTLNDIFFSITTHALLEVGSTAFMGLFDMTLFPTDGEHISRSHKPFKRNEMDQKRFYYNQNYGALNLVAGPGIGDAGSPDGGNLDTGDNVMNSYRPYNPTGFEEYNAAQWLNTWISRICFNGEGPFYYADPNARTVKVNGKTYHEYLRPNGKVYALVNTDSETWKYIYPTDIGDAEDEDTLVVSGYLSPSDKKAGDKIAKKQRFNRYFDAWDSDYFIIKYPLMFGNTYVSPDNSSGNLDTTTISSDKYAGALHYKELIEANDHRRACASPLEAFYRNHQWLWNEKKVVSIIPLYLSADLSAFGLGAGFIPIGAVYQTAEVNGMGGFADARKFKGNHIWAKKGESGTSTIPGDYRVELAASLTTDTLDLGLTGSITEQLVFEMTFDVGNFEPSIIGKNAPSISRLAFPRSPKMIRENGIEDYTLGSLEFEVGDDIWEHRSAYLPLFVSLTAGMYDNTVKYPYYNDPDSKTNIRLGGKIFFEGLAPLLKPLMYYQKDKGSPPYNCWKPRVYGDSLAPYGNFQGNAYLQSSAAFYSDKNPLVDWDGSEEEQLFFLPAPIKTLINSLVDSDVTDPARRMDGIIPLILSKTKMLTAMLKMLLSDVNDTDEFNQAFEQMITSLKTTRGEMTRILEGEERYGEGGSPKKFIYPDWMFVEGIESTKDAYGVYTEFTGARDEDTIFDDIVDALVGKDAIDDENDGYGLASYPDDKKSSDGKPDFGDADWKDFEDGFDDLVHLAHKDSKYSITESIISINESFFGNGCIYSDDQITGLLYGAGKLFTYYDSVKKEWVYQGQEGFDDIYKILTETLPDIHDQIKDEPTEIGGSTYTTDNYWDMLMIVADLLKEGGILDYVIDTVTVDAEWEKVFGDLDTFLKKDFISSKDPLWSTVSRLIEDMSVAMDESQGVDLESLYRDYGFQLN